MFGISTPQWAPSAGPCRIVSSLQVCSRPAFTTCQFKMLSRAASRKVPIQTVLDFILAEKLMQKRKKLKTIVPYKTGPTLSCLARRFEPTTHARTHIYTREAGQQQTNWQADRRRDRREAEEMQGDWRVVVVVVVVVYTLSLLFLSPLPPSLSLSLLSRIFSFSRSHHYYFSHALSHTFTHFISLHLLLLLLLLISNSFSLIQTREWHTR